MRIGEIVKYDEKWCREEERDNLGVVVEWFDDVKRGYIANVGWNLFLIPKESVTEEMIKSTEMDIWNYHGIENEKAIHDIECIRDGIDREIKKAIEKEKKSRKESKK